MSNLHTVIAIPAASIEDMRELLLPYVKRSFRSQEGINTDAANALLNKAALGWVVVLAILDSDDSEAWPDSMRAVAVVSVIEHEQGRALRVVALSGEGLGEWLEGSLLPELELLAREQDAAFLYLVGRRGWERVLRKHRWRPLYRRPHEIEMVRTL